MADQRVQVDDLRVRSPLGPVARPVDTYYQVKPETVQLEGGGSFADLAKSIGVATPIVQKALSEEDKYQQDLQIKAGAEARLKNQKSFKQAQDEGLIRPAENPWFVKGYMVQDGRLSGMNYDAAQRTAWMESEAKNSDDPKAFMKFQGDFRTKWLEQHKGATPDWMEGFRPKMEQSDGHLAGQHVAYRQGVIEQKLKDNTGIEISKLHTEMTEVLNAPETRMLGPEADTAIRAQYTEKLTALGRDLVAKGLSGKDFNQMVTDQSISFARQMEDETLLDIGRNVRTGSGTVGQITESNKAFTSAEYSIRSERAQRMQNEEYIAAAPDRARARVFARDNEDHTRERWVKEKQDADKKIRVDARISEMMMRFQQGKPLDQTEMNALIKDDPNSASWVQDYIHKRLTQNATIIPDQQKAAQMMIKVDRDASAVSAQDIYGMVRPGGITIEMANGIYAKWQHNTSAENSAANKDPYFKESFDGLVKAAGATMTGTGADQYNGWKAGEEYRIFYDETIKGKDLPQSQKLKLMREKSLEILTHYGKVAAQQSVVGKENATRVQELSDAQARREAAARPPVPAAVVIPQNVIDHLRKNPQLAEQFEKDYDLKPGDALNYINPPLSMGQQAGVGALGQSWKLINK